ncbi:unnamed protein product [Camellia sinensis]
MRMIFESFGIEEYYKEKALDENIVGKFRSMKCRLPKENEDPLGLAIHVDKTIITILCQNSVQGLEVLTKEGKWIKLNIPKGALVVIVGDGLQAWTNVRVEAVKHRVVMSGDKERLSCGFFFTPKDGVSVEIPPQLVDKEHPLRYRSFVYSDYFAKYITSTRLDTLESFADTRGRRLNRSEDLVDGQPVFYSLPPVIRRKPRRRSVSEQRLPEQWSSLPADNQAEASIFTTEREYLPVIQLEQRSMATLEEMVRQLQEGMKIMQQDAIRQAEFAKQQATIVTEQAELIIRLQQQAGAFASHQAPPSPRVPILEETPNVQNIQEDTDIPTGPAPPPILPQLSKAPTPINAPDSPFEFEVDPMALKLSKLEKMFKKSQGVKTIPDIEDGYTDTVVTLPDRFKMPHIDRFDGSGDPMVHLRLFSDILRPMGLTRLQKLSLLGRTLLGVAAIWYAKLEYGIKRNWDEMAEAFIAQYSYNTQIEITTRDLETIRQDHLDFKTALKMFGSNIIFSNGLLDPWSGGSVLEDVSETIVALVTEKGAHHLDLRAATAEDPDWLVAQRATEIKLIQGWLNDYYLEKKPFSDM